MTDAMLLSTIRRAVSGDPGAERELLRHILPAVQRGVASVLRKAPRGAGYDWRQELMDLAQQSLLHLFEDRGKRLLSWDPDRGLDCQRYIELITRRYVVSVLRARRKNPWELRFVEPSDLDALMGEDEAESPEQLVARQEHKIKVLSAVEAELSDKGRAVLAGLVAGKSITDVAGDLHISTNAVHVWRTRIARIAAHALGQSTEPQSPDSGPAPSLGRRERSPREAS